MSEIINNRQQRVDIMKALIRQLHDGVAEERVQNQLEKMLVEADYSDVFLMEMQLIQEGVPQESIQRLCDTHTRVLKKQLDLQETPETTPGHPVHTFVQENKAIAFTTQKIRRLFDQIDGLPPQEDAMPQMLEIHARLNDLMDIDKHYRRKENLLFPYFEKKNMPGPPAVMWGKHDDVRRQLKSVLSALQGISEIEASEARAFNRLAVETVLDAIDDMIYKEEKVLFPTAMDLLDEQEWYEIYNQSDEIGYCLFDPQFKWVPEGSVVESVNEGNFETGRIHMPTGYVSLTELMAIFKTMPFDLTFVDKDDIVRYFSPGQNRIFDRSRAILGRKVQYCHPPKSMHIVNQILNDFKSNKQNEARFWIRLGPRLVYIVYYALRDDQNNYLGTLEVTQDVTEINQLEGERRLLEYDEK
ncbi:MAG: DUF438 domain-containing protein [Calditrichaeota bacterium]|nr:DUF438 domain-containing protein [Calditrichota bacterium]